MLFTFIVYIIFCKRRSQWVKISKNVSFEFSNPKSFSVLLSFQIFEFSRQKWPKLQKVTKGVIWDFLTNFQNIVHKLFSLVSMTFNTLWCILPFFFHSTLCCLQLDDVYMWNIRTHLKSDSSKFEKQQKPVISFHVTYFFLV